MAKHNQQSNGVSARKSICISNHLELMMQSQQSYISELRCGAMWIHVVDPWPIFRGLQAAACEFRPRTLRQEHVGMTVFEDVLACLDVMLPYLTKTNPTTINSYPSDTIERAFRLVAISNESVQPALQVAGLNQIRIRSESYPSWLCFFPNFGSQITERVQQEVPQTWSL